MERERPAEGPDEMTELDDETIRHREAVKDSEAKAPSREKFRAMLERFPSQHSWLDDEDWNL